VITASGSASASSITIATIVEHATTQRRPI
jgi:hypothetical protein